MQVSLHVSAALTDFCFPGREKGRLGRLPKDQADAKEEERSVDTLKTLLIPKRIPGLTKVVHVACGWYNSYAVTESKAVYAWGLNNYGAQQAEGALCSDDPAVSPAFSTGLAWNLTWLLFAFLNRPR